MILFHFTFFLNDTIPVLLQIMESDGKDFLLSWKCYQKLLVIEKKKK